MEIFGFEFGKKQKLPDADNSYRLPIDEGDGTTVTSSGTQISYQMASDPTWKSEADLIKYYRDMSLNHNVDRGIEEIVSDAIVVDRDRPVDIDFTEETKISNAVRRKISDEFDNVLNLLDFKNEGHTMFRDWYIDGRYAVFMVVDPSNTRKGIVDLQKLDVKSLKKVRQIKTKKSNNVEVVDSINEYFVYSNQNDSTGMYKYMVNKTELRIKPEAISYITSGLIDKSNNWIISYLHKAIRPQNHLRLLEDAALIYKMVRAPERRVFYIDVGNLPRNRAEEYLRDIMAKYRNKITYDAATGDIKDDRRAMSMMEDFWLPRRDGGRGTEISTLPGGTNQGIDDLEYFKKNLYEALNIPLGRLEASQGFSLGRSSEITRDEVKFSSFISKLRNRFSGLFYDILKTQLILKGIITPSDWEDYRHDINFVFNSNVLFAELKEAEILQSRIENLGAVEGYVGKYFSKRWVQKNVLMMTDEDIDTIEADMAEELANMPQDGFDTEDDQPEATVRKSIKPKPSDNDDNAK